jgi:hypothetical protein
MTTIQNLTPKYSHSFNLTGKRFYINYCSILANKSLSRNRWYSLSSISTLVPPYSGSKTLSPTFTARGTKSPFYDKKKIIRQFDNGFYPNLTYICSRSWSNCNDCAFQNFLLSLLGNNNSTSCFSQGLGPFDQNTIEHWDKSFQCACLKKQY